MTLPNPKINIVSLKMHFLLFSTILHCHCSSLVASIKLGQLDQYCHAAIILNCVFGRIFCKCFFDHKAIAAEDNKFLRECRVNLAGVHSIPILDIFP